MIADHHNRPPLDRPFFHLGQKLKGAVGFLAHEEGDILDSPLLHRPERPLRSNACGGPVQRPLESVGRDIEGGYIDQHVHDQVPLEDSLIDVFDVAGVLEEKGGDRCDDPLPVGAFDTNPSNFFWGGAISHRLWFLEKCGRRLTQFRGGVKKPFKGGMTRRINLQVFVILC